MICGRGHDVPEESWWGDDLFLIMSWPGISLLDIFDKYYFIPKTPLIGLLGFLIMIGINFLFWLVILRIMLIPLTKKNA